MKYTGKLYGRIGRKFCPVEMTSDDVDALQERADRMENALKRIRNNGYDGRRLTTAAVDDFDLEKLGIKWELAR